MFRMIPILVLALVVASPAAGDEIVAENMTYPDIDVVGCAGGVLIVRMPDGRQIRKWLGDVQRIRLDSDVAFSKAEELLSGGKYGEAIAAYNALVPAAKDWRKDLLSARIELAQQYRTTPPAPKSAPASRPAPQSRPTSAPAAKSPPPQAPAKNPATGAVGDLSSPDRMAELLAKRPRHPQVRLNWQKMNDQERAEAVKQYEQDVKRWDENHDYRGRSVQWTLAVVAIHKNSQQTVVEMTSPAGYMITADLEDSAVAAAQALKPDQNVEVSGVIEDYRLENESGGLFDSGAMRFGVALKQATVKPARK